MPYQVEFIGSVAFVEQVLPGIEAHVLGAPADESAERLGQSGEELMLADDALKSLHRTATPLLLRCRELRGPLP